MIGCCQSSDPKDKGSCQEAIGNERNKVPETESMESSKVKQLIYLHKNPGEPT